MSPDPRQPQALSPTSYRELYEATPLQRVAIIKRGLPARDARQILNSLGPPHEQLFQVLKVARATVSRKAALGLALGPGESERILGVACLIGQMEAMTQSDPEFDASAWLGGWLWQPLPALGGQRPLDLLDTIEGQRLVATMLARIQSVAFT